MLTKTMAIIGLVSSFTTMAKTQIYDLDMKINLTDSSQKTVLQATPHLKVRPGHPGFVTQQTNNAEPKRFMKITANEGKVVGHQGIMMNVELGIIDKAGQKTILARPQVLANEGEPATFTQTIVEKKGAQPQTLSFTVTAKRQTL